MEYEEINFTEDSISISDDKGEIVFWSIDEWKENPQVVFSICNAIKLCLEKKDLREIIKEKLKGD